MRIDLALGDDIAAVVRAAAGESVVVVIAPGRDALATALVHAAVAPLAIERATGMRFNAVVPAADAEVDDVDAAVAFLDGARSTTGQVLAVA